MTHARKPRRKYRPRPVHIPMLIKTQLTLEPLEQVIDQIERAGTVDTDAAGVPIFYCNADGHWYASGPAITGMADFFRMWATRHRQPLDVSALQELGKRLELSMPMDGPLMARIHALVPTLRRIGSGMDRGDAIDLVQQTRIHAELEQRA